MINIIKLLTLRQDSLETSRRYETVLAGHFLKEL